MTVSLSAKSSRMRRVWRVIAPTLAALDLADVFLLAGTALLWVGLEQVWYPAPYVVIGSLCIWLALGHASPPAPPPPSADRR